MPIHPDDLQLEPEQPPAVADALGDLLAPPPRDPGPWWRAGIEEALEP